MFPSVRAHRPGAQESGGIGHWEEGDGGLEQGALTDEVEDDAAVGEPPRGVVEVG